MLIVYVGPMYAGKTTRLLQEYKKCSRKKYLIKHKISRGDGVQVISHTGMFCSADTFDIESVGTEPGVSYFIDEGQFFEGLPAKINSDCNFYVACLNFDFKKNEFPVSRMLMDMADEVHVITAECSECGSPGLYSKRVSDDSNIIAIYAAYTPRCEDCFHK